MEEIVHPENLNAAWEQVRRNHGAPGVDGINGGSEVSDPQPQGILAFEQQ